MFINECKICKYSGRKFRNYHNIHAMVIPCPVVWFRVILQALLLSLSLAPDHIRRAMIHRPGPPLPVREIWLRARRALGLWSYGWTSSVDTRTISCTIHGYQFIVNPAPAHIYRLYLFSVTALLEISDFTVCTFKHLQWLTVWFRWKILTPTISSFSFVWHVVGWKPSDGLLDQRQRRGDEPANIAYRDGGWRSSRPRSLQLCPRAGLPEDHEAKA